MHTDRDHSNFKFRKPVGWAAFVCLTFCTFILPRKAVIYHSKLKINKIKTMKNFLFPFFLLLSFQIIAQSPTQVIKGSVIDKDTKQPLIGATIQIVNSDPLIGTITDLEGNFRLDAVPVGRLQIKCSFTGYTTYLSDNIIVNSAKELVLNIEMVETAYMAEAAIVVAKKHGTEPLNELSIVSTRSFSVEETQRYAASANDPSRMTMGFPGVQQSKDSRNDINIRGNSGIGLLWRLEGIDIPNPNHFARRGSSGGGITIFSVSLLANSDFSTGAFPAEYGDAISGVFDIKFRNGNQEKREYSFRAGMLGLDFSTEGPFKKGQSSYLVNYRYSTLGLLNQMGIYLVNPRTDNIFQDLSFKLFFPSKDNKSILTIWGIGGLSNENERTIDSLTAESSYNERLTRDFQTKMGALGATYTYLIDDKSYLTSSVAAMGQNIIYKNDTLNLERIPSTVNDEEYTNIRYSLSSYYNRKLSSKTAFKVGLFLSSLNYKLYHQDLNTEKNKYDLWLNDQGSTVLIQPYVQFRFQLSKKWTLNAGAHAMFLTLNNTNSIEPRLGIKYQMTPKSSLSFAYGLHSKMVPIGTYFTRIEGFQGLASQPNMNLDLIKSHHVVLAFNQNFAENMDFHIEAYYQSLYNVPIGIVVDSTYSILNEIEGYATQTLSSNGTATNYGLDISVEKYFSFGAFFIISGSIFNSTYVPFDGKTYNTRYNTNYAGTFMGGKEWSFENNSVFQFGLKILYNAGARVTPLIPGDEIDGPTPPYDNSRPFEDRVSPYFRPDIRLAYRKDNPKSAWTIALDVQNIINRKNEDSLDRTYDPDTMMWTGRDQSGLTPILSFQIDF